MTGAAGRARAGRHHPRRSRVPRPGRRSTAEADRRGLEPALRLRGPGAHGLGRHTTGAGLADARVRGQERRTQGGRGHAAAYAHELGALMAAASAAAEGWSVTYLGPDLPVADLVSAVGQSARERWRSARCISRRVAICSGCSATPGRGFPADVTLLVGGAGALRDPRGGRGRGRARGRVVGRVSGPAPSSGAGGGRMTRNRELILLTGATGYVGGRLLRALEADGRRLRCMARRPEYLRARVGEGTEVVAGDVLQPDTLPAALRGVDTAYYLIHSMATSRHYATSDRTRRGGIRPRCPGGRCAADHLSRWPGRGRPAVPASGEPPAGRPHPARVGRAHDRVPRLDRDRVRQPLLRAGPRAGREAPDHADAALGRIADSAHRGRGPGGLPGRRARPAERLVSSSTRSAGRISSPTVT